MGKYKVCFVLAICLLCCSNIFHSSAQDVTQLEKSLDEIDKDLQRTSLNYSWMMAEEYLKYCETFDQMINITKEDYLKVLTYEKKPQELKPFEEAYKDAKEEAKTYMRKYSEYVKAEQLRKKAISESERKDATNTMNSVCSRLWNEDPKVQELRAKEQTALRTYRIETVRYMLNEYKKLERIMPDSFIEYKDKNKVLDNNLCLKRMSQEIAQLERLQREVLNKCQRLKYNLEEKKENILE